MMGEEEESFDPYEVLGLSHDASCSRDEISKSARKLGLKYHPDKNPDTSAEAKFLAVQKAKDLLLDDKRRKEYDAKRTARDKRKHFDEQRSQGMDDRRKRFKADLEKKINTNNSGSRPQQSSSSSSAGKQDSGKQQKPGYEDTHSMESKNLSKADLERRANGEKILGEMLEHRKKMAVTASVFSGFGMKDTGLEQADLEPEATDIKVKWKRSGMSQSDDSLYQMFNVYGEIEEVRVTGSKGTSAIVSFRGGKAVAQKAVDAFVDNEDFRVSLLSDDKDVKKKAAVFTHDFQTVNVGTAAAQTSASSSSSGISKGVTGMSRGVEMGLVKEIRRAVERRNLLKAAEAAEEAQAQAQGPGHGRVDRDDNSRVSNAAGGRQSGGAEGEDLEAYGLSALKSISYDELIDMEQRLRARLQATAALTT